MSEQRGVILGDWLWILATVWLVIGIALFFGCRGLTSHERSAIVYAEEGKQP